MRKVLVNSLIVVMSIFLTYAVLEVGYRVVTYIQLSNGYEPFTVWWTDQPLHLADEEVGYRYPADANVRYTQTEPPDVSVYATNVLTNNDGLPATIDVPKQKAEREYRIALIGDSFTAGVFNSASHSHRRARTSLQSSQDTMPTYIFNNPKSKTRNPKP